MRDWSYGKVLDHFDHIYEQHRDEDHLDEEAESAYLNRKYQKLKRTMTEE